ncbi:MAG: hypothetical protein ACTSP9_01320 [Promethearchaeota archaeon]
MVSIDKNYLVLNLNILSLFVMDGLNNQCVIRSNDVLITNFEDLSSFVHHWLDHK